MILRQALRRLTFTAHITSSIEWVGAVHLRPYYQLASHPVHANAKGLYFKLGAFERRGTRALATNHGFANADVVWISDITAFDAGVRLAGFASAKHTYQVNS